MAARGLPVRERGAAALALVAGAALLLGGCGEQSALDPASKPSREIAALWWWMLGAAGLVLGGAIFLLLLAWVRRRVPGLPFLGKHERVTTALVVVFGIVIPLATNVAVFVVANFVVAKATTPPPGGAPGMTIEVVGHQWFWEVRYPGTGAVTANEIHIPVGRSVNVVATTDDVIHSFWVPQLNRKIDMIPGHPNRLVLKADRPGRYRGQCAEYCGAQHAHMAMYVYADPPARFRAWLAGVAAPRRAPATAPEARGERVFLRNACASCHAIRGTSARGTIGPDLTHVGARGTLAALDIPNRPDTLAHWLRDPQDVKPGNRMPQLSLADRDERDLVAYLEHLR